MKRLMIVALALAIGLGTAASPFASAAPDGLNRVAKDHAFSDTGKVAPLQERSPVPGYAFPGVRNERVAKGLAGFTGTLLVFALGIGVITIARRRPALP